MDADSSSPSFETDSKSLLKENSLGVSSSNQNDVVPRKYRLILDQLLLFVRFDQAGCLVGRFGSHWRPARQACHGSSCTVHTFRINLTRRFIDMCVTRLAQHA